MMECLFSIKTWYSDTWPGPWCQCCQSLSNPQPATGGPKSNMSPTPFRLSLFSFSLTHLSFNVTVISPGHSQSSNELETFGMHCRREMWVSSYVGGKQHLNLGLSMPEKRASHKQFFLDTMDIFKEVFFRRSLLFNCDRVVIDFNIVIFPMILFPIYQSIPKHQALWLAIVIFYY